MNRYRQLRSPAFGRWAAAAITLRLPNAAAPLAVVFAGHGATGTYATGGLLATVFVIGEIIGAVLAAWFARSARVGTELALGLCVGALGYSLLLAAVLGPTPVWLPFLGAFLAGGGPAQSPGAMKMFLGRVVPEDAASSAFSADSLITEIVWLTAPPLVAWSAVAWSPMIPVAACGALLVAAIPLTLAVARWVGPAPRTPQPRPPRRVLVAAWPAFLTSAAALSLVAVAELILPSLLQFRGYSAAWSGVILAVYAAASAVTAVAYGARTWKGSARRHSLLMLGLTAAGVAAAAVIPSALGIAVALAVAGAAQSVVMITRSLLLRAELPTDAHTAGFTTMYAVQGAGYALSAALASSVLGFATPPAAIGCGVLLMLVLSAASVVAEGLRTARGGGGRS